jgi:hypothetical protein
MHSGGSTALFPNRFWQFQHKNHTPTPKQKTIFEHFDKCAQYALQERKGRNLIVVHDGDAIDGYHHMTEQVVTQNKQEQSEIHQELMDYFLRAIRFKKAEDTLYYVNGTEVHTGSFENAIAKDMGAKRNPEGGYVYDHLELTINRRLLWFAHHGKGRGTGANEGNGLRNFLRDVYWDCRKRDQIPPDCIVTGHTHTYIVREKSGFREMHGVIAPSWQMKTRYGYRVAAVEVNEIGAVCLTIGADGEMSKPKFLLMPTK